MAETLAGQCGRKLNEMVVSYALRRRIPFREGWKLFADAFYRRYHARLSVMRRSYEQDSGRKLTMPAFLAETGWMEQALRIAEEMNIGAERTISGKPAAGSCPGEGAQDDNPCVQHPA